MAKSTGAKIFFASVIIVGLLVVFCFCGSILAAIAIPNFLEAQTRSKVSRARADLRMLTTVVEIYYLDYKHYPPSPKVDGEIAWINSLTTPISYLISNEHFDPFQKNNARYRFVDFTEQRKTNPDLPPYIVYSAGPDEDYDLHLMNGQLVGVTSLQDLQLLEYNAQRGTVSNGDIIRFGEP